MTFMNMNTTILNMNGNDIFMNMTILKTTFYYFVGREVVSN